VNEIEASAVRRWKDHPAAMVREVFGATPDVWQEDVLEKFPHCQRQAMTACKGPGKSTVLSWLIWNFLLTRIEPKIVCTSITGDNLNDGLWAELALWRNRSPLLKAQFEWTTTKVFYKEFPETWFASARTWPRYGNPQQQADTLAGVHATHAMLVLDEAGGIPISVLASGDAVLSSGGDTHIIMAGNPTNQDSALGFAVLNQRHLWDVTEITGDPEDPKRSPRVSIEWAKEQIAAWGRDNPWVMVNVFGRFPASGLNTMISPDEVRDAQKRHYTAPQYESFPKVMGVDVARFGDDESVIFKRQGKVAFPPLRMRNLDSLQGGSHVARMATEWGADSIQIDATGGYGAGWYDHLHGMNFTHALAVQFAGRAHQPERYYNKRAEMMFDLCAWIKDGGALPPVPEMVVGLSTQTYTFKGGRILVEEKQQIKDRIGRSPDLEDALACTFAYPVAPKPAYYPGGAFGLPILDAIRGTIHQHDYDPLAREFGDPK
jgi:phage terminase large subunit